MPRHIRAAFRREGGSVLSRDLMCPPERFHRLGERADDRSSRLAQYLIRLST